MAELADALDSGSSERKLMGVQVPPLAPSRRKQETACVIFLPGAQVLPVFLTSHTIRFFSGAGKAVFAEYAA